MSAKKSNQKWIFIGIAVVALLTVAFWYFTKEEGTKEMAINEPGLGEAYAEPGDAESLDDLPPACRKKFDSWSKWVKTDNNWFKEIEESAKKNGVSLSQQIKNVYVHMYNRESVEC